MRATVNKWKLVSGLLLVLVLGILMGSIGTGFYLKYRFAHYEPGSRVKDTFIVEKLSKELDLTLRQKAQIAPIVAKMIEERREYYLQIRPEVKSIMDRGFSQIEQQLNEDQKKKLDALREKFERRRAERRARRLRK